MQQFGDFLIGNWPLFLALVIVLALLARTLIGPGAAKSFSPMEALQSINHRDALVLDVRSDAEYAEGHVLNALHIPLGLLAGRLGQLEAYRDHPIVVICRSGARSAQAAAQLRKAGFNEVFNLAGGVMAWQNASLPLTRDKGRPPKPGRKAEAEAEQTKEASAPAGLPSRSAEQAVASTAGDAATTTRAPEITAEEPAAASAVVETAGEGPTATAPEIVIYSSAMCPYCVRAIGLLKSKGVTYTEISVDGNPEARFEMEQKAGASSVPQIFVDGQHIGDCDGIYALDQRGELDALLGLKKAEA